MRDRPTKDHRPTRPWSRSPDRGDTPAKSARPSRRDASPGSSGFAAKPSSPAAARPRPAHKKPLKRHDEKQAPFRAHDAEAGGEEGGAQRIAKVMARAGLCSRRTAESWIAEGRVALNGEPVRDPAVNVSAADKITVDDEPLARPGHTRLFLFHKPRGLVSTERDPEGRATIFDYLREHWPDGPRVVSVGRLDINTEGLLLLTNDGGLARILELPSTGWVRRYRVRAKGETDQSILDRLREGVTVDGMDYAGIEATLDREQGANNWLTLALREGKNREIKRVLEHVGLTVNRLIRLSFGPFQLGELAEGAVEEVRTRVLRDQLGPSLAKAAGVDFSSPPADAPGVPERVESRRQERPHTGGRDREERGAGPRGAREPRQRETRPPERTPSAEARFKPEARPRKHITALRAEESAGQGGARKRIERRETADRSGRTIQVERLVSTEVRSARQDKLRAPATRNGRRFDAERKSRDGEIARPAGGRTSRPVSTTEGSREAKRTRWDKGGAPSGRERTPKRFDEHPRPERPTDKTENGRPARRAAGTGGGRATTTEERQERPRTRWDKAGAQGGQERPPKRFDERPRSARPTGKTEGGRPASGPAGRPEASQERKRTHWEKAGAHGERAPATKRFDVGARAARPKGKTEGGGPVRASRPSAGGKPGGKGGPMRGSGPGKGRPRDKR